MILWAFVGAGPLAGDPPAEIAADQLSRVRRCAKDTAAGPDNG